MLKNRIYPNKSHCETIFTKWRRHTNPKLLHWVLCICFSATFLCSLYVTSDVYETKINCQDICTNLVSVIAAIFVCFYGNFSVFFCEVNAICFVLWWLWSTIKQLFFFSSSLFFIFNPIIYQHEMSIVIFETVICNNLDGFL